MELATNATEVAQKQLEENTAASVVLLKWASVKDAADKV